MQQQEKILFAWINARMKSVQKVMMDSVKGYLLDLTGENMELIDGDVQFRFIVGNSSRSEAGSILYAF